MSETVGKSIRLSQAIREFNLGLEHIVEFLSKKGINIDSNPNSKIPTEAYALLLKEFQSDRIAKEEARHVTESKIRKDTSVILDATSIKQPQNQEEEHNEIIIKNISGYRTEEKPKAKKVEAEVAKPEPPKTEAPKTEEPSKAKPEIVKLKPEIETPKVVGKIELEDDKTRKSGRMRHGEAGKSTKAKKSKEQEIAAQEKEEKKKGAAKKTTKKKKQDEGTKVAAPVEEEISSAPVAEAPVQEAPVVEPPPVTEAPKEAEAPKQEIHRLAVDKLSGPTVLGKIELPVEPPKKKPVASSSGVGDLDRRKKRRKRSEKKFGKAGTSAPPQGAKPREFEPRNKFKPGGRRGDRHVAAPRPEVTDKEIQDQIKATLARLSGTGKSKASKLRKAKREAFADEQEALAAQAAEKKVIKVTEFVSANELARLMDVPVTEVISTCMSLGLFVSINQRLDAETLTVVAEEFGYAVEFVSAEVQENIRAEEDKPEALIPRAPIVTVMGHVDHGKTSLLDYIRKTNVIAGEAGGITQHIGAYEVKLENGKRITFLDTPGHEAFTAMRARGAKVTDVAIVVVAADDNVMPQTVEAINHAQAAGVPIVFAINKIDKPEANPDHIREQLSKMNILVEEWGGKYQSQEISAKKGINLDALLEKVLLEAELLDLKANPDKRATGTVIESSLDKGRGYVTTVLVQAGTLKIGDIVLAGCHSGRVKALFNERGSRIEEAGPSSPALMLGLTGAPQAGDLFNVMEDEREARDIATKRLALQREQGIRTHKHITLDEIGRRLAIGNFKELNVIVKGDVDGSIEALADSLLKLSNPEIQVNVIHKSVGQITESDVLLASASNAIVIGFQVRPSLSARKLAEQEEIDIRLYSIIYNAINEVKAAMEGMLAPEFIEKTVCNVEIREIFKIPKVGTVAGCMVLDGKIQRNTKVRVVRDGIVVFTGELASLRRFKDDVKEVASGYECGLNIANFNDIKVGDVIEGYEQVAVKRTLAAV